MSETAIIDPATAERLTRLLGMLGSDHEGEVANAGRLADRLVRGLGLRWADLIGSRAETRLSAHWREPRTWREAVGLCLQYSDIITAWESQFLRSLRDFRAPTGRQHE